MYKDENEVNFYYDFLRKVEIFKNYISIIKIFYVYLVFKF